MTKLTSRITLNPYSIVDTQSADPIRAAMLAEFREAVAKLLKQRCHSKAQQVMRLRYGLDGGLSYTSNQVARIMKMNRCRALSIECLSLAKLRKHPELMSILTSA